MVSSNVYVYLILNLKISYVVVIGKLNTSNFLPPFHIVSQKWNSHLESGILYVKLFNNYKSSDCIIWTGH